MDQVLWQPPALSQEATLLAWTLGRLKYKLQPKQKVAYDLIRGSLPENVFCVVCSRGFGKTFIACDLAIETARRERDVNILIISSTLKKLRKIVKPAFDTLLFDCPEELRPRYNTQDGFYEFPETNVRVHLCAAEKGHIEDLRGIHKVVLVLIDEAAFFGAEEDTYPLDDVVENILNPMFLRTASKARIIMMSTPPEVPNHPFDAYCDAAALTESIAKFTIYESDIPPEKIAEQKARCRDEIAWRREYLCERVIDAEKLIIPEWRDEYVCEWPRHETYFQFYHLYEGMDMGVVDLTVNLFGYYDFKAAKLITEDEISMNGPKMTTNLLADAIKGKESDLWGISRDEDGREVGRKVYRRIADNNNPLLLQDLASMHGISFAPVAKNAQGQIEPTRHILNAMVNELRMFVADGRLIVHPRCKQLIGCLKNGIWDKSKREFGNSKVYGHFDALAALIYLLRNINQVTNPIPAMYGLDKATHHIPKNFGQQQNGAALKKIFGLRK